MAISSLVLVKLLRKYKPTNKNGNALLTGNDISMMHAQHIYGS